MPSRGSGLTASSWKITQGCASVACVDPSTINGHTQVVQLEMEWTFGRKQRQRPWFRCPVCLRRCRTLHEKDGTSICCWKCTGYDFRSRHKNRGLPAANRVRRVGHYHPAVVARHIITAGLPQRALARERIIAQVEIARLLRATVRDLERRAKRGKR